jgi:hypothetical protein
MVLEAGYKNTTGFRKVVKATSKTSRAQMLLWYMRVILGLLANVHRVLVKKKPDISDDNFIKHYNEKHAQAAAPVLLKHKIISYSLVCLFSFASSPGLFIL